MCSSCPRTRKACALPRSKRWPVAARWSRPAAAGPEELVIDGETGFLVGFDPVEMGDAIPRMTGNEILQQRLAEAARGLVLRNHSVGKAEGMFWAAFKDQFAYCMRAT